MADRPVALTEADARILQRMIDREKRQTINTPLVFDHSDRGDDQQAPETYVAKVPQFGIPALGQAYGDTDDEPGSAECSIYQIVDGPETPRFLQIGTLFQRVYNLSTSPVSGDDWVPITKDKFGRWLVLVPGSGGVTEIVRFRILSACPGLTGDTSPDSCNCVQAVVTRVVCGSVLQPGDLLTIWDIDHCWFNTPLDLLLERSGTAILMENNVTDGSAPNCTGYGDVRPDDCFWNVESLCCSEEAYATA